MQIQRFTARDSKSALAKVRANLGTDARILSTDRSELGIEISAVTGESFSESASPKDTLSNQSANEITLGYLDRELKELRQVLYNALGERAWQDVADKKPVSSTVEQRLVTLGLSKLAIESIMLEVDTSQGLNSAWASVLAVLLSSIEVAGGDSASEAPKAIIGANSGGRSIVTQQLINSSLLHLKPSKILLISVTEDPSGALIDFCKEKKIKRIQTSASGEVAQLLTRFKGRRRIFIETRDMSPALEFDDPVLDILSDKSLAVEAILVLSAELQSEVLAATIKHTEHLQLGGSVISGFSDALALGPILDMLILERMRVIGVSKHSEAMLRAATPNLIINRAKHLARKKMGRTNAGFQSSKWSRSA